MKKLLNIILIISLVMILFSCQKDKLIIDEYSLYYFDTTIEIKYEVLKTQKEEVYKLIDETFSIYHKLTNSFVEYGNNIYKLNHTNEAIELDEKLINLLQVATSYSYETNGYFNPYIGNISLIYKDIISTKTLSNIEKIPEELENLKNTKLEIDGNFVKRIGLGTIDLGAIAKGYAVSEVKKILEQYNITNYIVNAGSSTIILGSKNGEEYKVGLKYDDLHMVKLMNTSIGSSSINEQNVEIDGKIYHHIVNPKTGLCENKYSTIYVIHDDPVLVDVYTTAFFNMDLEDIKTISTKENIKVIVYQNGQIIYMSEGVNYA